MSRGLPARPFPIFLSGGLDTKTDPRLVPAGSMLEVENMFYLRTGELRLRNGFAALLGQTNVLFEVAGLWSDIKGRPNALARASVSGLFVQGNRYMGDTIQTWVRASPIIGLTTTNGNAYPNVTCERLTGTSPSTTADRTTPVPPTTASLAADGDVAGIGAFEIQSWIDANVPTRPQHYAFRFNATEGAVVDLASTATRPPVVVANANSTQLAVFTLNSAGTTIDARIESSTGSGISGTPVVGVDAAAPWFDAKDIPGANRIAIAFKASAGGVTVQIIDTTTLGTVVGPVNIPGADASMCLGFLDDSSATGNLFLATAGATSGVVCRTMSIAALAIGATNVVDATATTNIRQITGQTNGSATNFYVFWDVAATPLYYSLIRRGRVLAGVSTVNVHARAASLYSRSFKASDGRYYLLTSYDSATQPTLILIFADPKDTTALQNPTQFQLCVVFPGISAGRRVYQSSLTSAFTDTLGRSVLSAGRKVSANTTSQERIALTFGGKVTARELGGLIFTGGGVVTQDDGTTARHATHVFYLEPVAPVSTAGGSMSGGKTYSYLGVIAFDDATGNRVRSAKSIPVAVTLTAGHGSATLTLQNPRIPARYTDTQAIEIYRAGPAEDGDTTYNKVGETYSNPIGGGDTLTFVDTMSDAASEAGEQLYSTGNVLENFVTPSTKLLEVCNGRLWIASAETTDELWPSKEFKSGSGIGFNPLLAFRVTGDGYGALTALSQMDGRLIVFKSGAIYAISGDGPNDLGQGTFNPPQAASLSNGTTNPASVVATPDGVLFQSTKGGGLWLLDRGLGLTYAGAGVEQYTLSASIVGASLVNGTTQVRFVLSDGRCLVLDYSKKTATSPAGSWTTFLLRVQGSTVVACADIPAGWCYACADGRVYQETPGVFSDVNSVSTIAIIPAVTFPILAVGGINGFARLYAADILGEYVGDHTLSAALTVDYDLVSTPRTKVITAATGALQMQVKPTNQKGTAYRLRITSAHAAGSGAFRLSAVTLWAGIKRGSFIPDTKRIP